VGCGAISTLYQLPALRQRPEVDLVAVVDVDGTWAASVARKFGAAESFTDAGALAGRVDAALIATPNTTHADIACGLLERGIHVLCEKPMATSTADAERMFAAAARGGARLMAAHCLRFSPNLVMLERVVSAGWLGPLRSVSGGIGAPYEMAAQRTDFRKQRHLSGGGVLIDLGIHLIDLTIWLAGEAPLQTSYDDLSAGGWEVETDAEVALEFPRGASASLACSFSHFMENVLTVRGEAGWARASLYAPTQLTLFSKQARICRRSGVQDIVVPDASMYERQLEHFCRAVETHEDFVVRDNEVRASIGVVEDCYRGERAAA
jgi:predicted dehydrogenase